jgi:hypothetical protein
VQIDEVLPEGYYKVRARKAGPWIPIRIWLEDGDRDPETWELESDQIWKAEWAPRTDSPRLFPVDPFQFINRARRISKDEFQWLLTLRTIPSRQPSRKRSSA